MHTLALECPPALRYSAAGHGHPATVVWPSHARFVPLRNAVELLAPKLDFFMRGAGAQLRGRYKVAVAGGAIVLEDACDGAKIHVKVANKNADLCTSFEECAAAGQRCLLLPGRRPCIAVAGLLRSAHGYRVRLDV